MLEVSYSWTNLYNVFFAGVNELYPQVVGGNGQLRADWQNWDILGPPFNPSVFTCSLLISGLVAKMGAEAEEMETGNLRNGTVGVQKQAYQYTFCWSIPFLFYGCAKKWMCLLRTKSSGDLVSSEA